MGRGCRNGNGAGVADFSSDSGWGMRTVALQSAHQLCVPTWVHCAHGVGIVTCAVKCQERRGA